MMKTIKWTILLVLLAGAGYAVYRFGLAAPRVEGESVEPAPLPAVARDSQTSVLATGTVKPKVGAQVNVGARVSGKVEKLSARIGDPVKKGQVIAKIEDKDLKSQVLQKEAQISAVKAQIAAERSNTAARLMTAEALAIQRQAELDVETHKLESLAQERELELSAVRAQIKETRAGRDLARKDMKRMENLFGQGMLPEQSLDRAGVDFSVAASRLQVVAEQEKLAKARLAHDVENQERLVHKTEAALDVAKKDVVAIQASGDAAVAVLEASLPRLEAELDEAKTRLSYATITAPIDGIVGTITTQEGETVAAGFAAPNFVTIVDLGQLQVDAYVDEADIGKVKAGQESSFTVDAFPGEEFHGRVRAVYPTAIIQDNVVYYDVVIEIEDSYAGRLRPEMTASVTLFLQEK